MSELRLTERDTRLLRECMDRLLSPADYESREAWGAALLPPVRTLIGADRAALTIPCGDGMGVLVADHDPAVVARYEELTRPMQQRYRFLDRGVAAGAHDRRTIWGAHFDAYRKSSYYNDYVIPARLYASLGMTVCLRRPVSLSTVAQLIMNSSRKPGGAYLSRGVGLLRLIYPAFRSTAQSWAHWAGAAGELVGRIDASPEPLLVFDERARKLHQNPAATAVLAGCGSAEAVQSAAIALVRAASAARRTGLPPVMQGRVKLEDGVIEVRLALAAAGAVAPRRCVLVTLVPPARRALPTVAQLEERFGFTVRQAEVARLMADRVTNPEIAERLGISVHTAKRHAEAVLMKLAVSSRRDVRARLLAPVAATRR